MGNASAQRKPTVQWAWERITCFLINLPPPSCVMYCQSLVKWQTQCSSFQPSPRDFLSVFVYELQESGLFYPNGMTNPSRDVFYGWEPAVRDCLTLKENLIWQKRQQWQHTDHCKMCFCDILQCRTLAVFHIWDERGKWSCSAALTETNRWRNESINSSHFQCDSRWLKRHNELQSPHRRHH